MTPMACVPCCRINGVPALGTQPGGLHPAAVAIVAGESVCVRHLEGTLQRERAKSVDGLTDEERAVVVGMPLNEHTRAYARAVLATRAAEQPDRLAALRKLCEDNMLDGVDADTVWPSEILAVIDARA